MTTKNNSILGDLARLYQIKSGPGGGILDSPQEGILELYPAGYTQTSNLNGNNRQDFYSKLWSFAVERTTENAIKPFDFDKQYTYTIDLLHDASNPYDSNAIHLIFSAPSNSRLAILDGGDMGFIPAKINTIILQNLDMIHDVRILKIRSAVHKKYFSAKIEIKYGDIWKPAEKLTTLSRFVNLMEE